MQVKQSWSWEILGISILLMFGLPLLKIVAIFISSFFMQLSEDAVRYASDQWYWPSKLSFWVDRKVKVPNAIKVVKAYPDEFNLYPSNIHELLQNLCNSLNSEKIKNNLQGISLSNSKQNSKNILSKLEEAELGK